VSSRAVERSDFETQDRPGVGRQVLAAAVFVALCYGTAALGNIATSANVDTWYAGVQRPSWTPPDWLFAPVWSTLYTLMAATAFLVWRQGTRRPEVRTALALFGAQLVLNLAWSWIFFEWHLLGAALAEIVVMLATIGAWGLASWRVSALAGVLVVPYFAWVAFATALNFAIWRMN
jgi:tryptophan-rich sensory protein